jgi:hypothetical protein
VTATDTPDTLEADGREPALGYYEGQPIVAAGVTINNASGGLHDAVSIDPVRLEVGDIVHVVLRCLVRPPQFDPVDKDNVRGPLKLVNRLHAEDATFVDAELVGGLIDQQRARIDEVKQREKDGHDERQLTLDDADDDGEPEQLGSVLDQAIDLAQVAEDGAAWRRERTAELDALGKTELQDLARDQGVRGFSSLTKAELVDAIVDAEEGEALDG